MTIWLDTPIGCGHKFLLMKIYSVHWKNKGPTEITGACSKREREGKTEFLDTDGNVIASFATNTIIGVQESDDGRTPEDDKGFFVA
jgi:hypothetical protein